MRITKKFTGACCIGKRFINSVNRNQITKDDIKRAAEELKQYEERFREALEKENDGFRSSDIMKRTAMIAETSWMMNQQLLSGYMGLPVQGLGGMAAVLNPAIYGGYGMVFPNGFQGLQQQNDNNKSQMPIANGNNNTLNNNATSQQGPYQIPGFDPSQAQQFQQQQQQAMSAMKNNQVPTAAGTSSNDPQQQNGPQGSNLEKKSPLSNTQNTDSPSDDKRRPINNISKSPQTQMKAQALPQQSQRKPFFNFSGLPSAQQKQKQMASLYQNSYNYMMQNQMAMILQQQIMMQQQQQQQLQQKQQTQQQTIVKDTKNVMVKKEITPKKEKLEKNSENNEVTPVIGQKREREREPSIQSLSFDVDDIGLFPNISLDNSIDIGWGTPTHYNGGKTDTPTFFTYENGGDAMVSTEPQQKRPKLETLET